MFDHELQDDEYESGIMSGLAVSGMSQGGGRKWKTALLYTPDLSGIVTVLRALVVYSARERRQDEIEENILQGWILMHRMDRPPIWIDPLSFWIDQSQAGMSD